MAKKKISCKKCKKGLFYMPSGYSMDIKVTCLACTDKKPTKPKKKTRQTASACYAKMKKGPRTDVHPTYSFRSRTEANVARIFNLQKVNWKFEERAFTFSDYKRKPHVYIMDFEITKGNKKFPAGFYEVKGYMTPQSRQKLRRLLKHYPEEAAKTTVIIYTKYKKKDIEFCKKLNYKIMFFDQLTKEFESKIPNWE